MIMKTTEEWFNQLPKDYRDKALKNMKYPNDKHYSLVGAISNGFSWDDSPEDKFYWNKVFREIMYGEKFEQGIEVNTEKQSLETDTEPQPSIYFTKDNDDDENTVTQDNTVKESITNNLFEQYKSQTQAPLEDSDKQEDIANLLKKYKLQQENNSL
jgi:hypothetical protein